MRRTIQDILTALTLQCTIDENPSKSLLTIIIISILILKNTSECTRNEWTRKDEEWRVFKVKPSISRSSFFVYCLLHLCLESWGINLYWSTVSTVTLTMLSTPAGTDWSNTWFSLQCVPSKPGYIVQWCCVQIHTCSKKKSFILKKNTSPNTWMYIH